MNGYARNESGGGMIGWIRWPTTNEERTLQIWTNMGTYAMSCGDVIT